MQKPVKYFTEEMHKAMYPSEKFMAKQQKQTSFVGNLKTSSIKNRIRIDRIGK